MRGEQAIFNLEIKKKSGLSINPDIHHSKVFSFVHSKVWSRKLLQIEATENRVRKMARKNITWRKKWNNS